MNIKLILIKSIYRFRVLVVVQNRLILLHRRAYLIGMLVRVYVHFLFIYHVLLFHN